MIFESTLSLVAFHEPLTDHVISLLDCALSPAEKAIIGWHKLDQSAGIGWVGPQSCCVWREDGRRITIGLNPPHGHCVKISAQPDTAVMIDQADTAVKIDQAVS